MEILRLLKELEGLIEGQKTFVGFTYDFRQDDFLEITNKIRATVLGLLSTERALETTATVLARHLRSPEEVANIMREIRAEAGA